MARARDGSIKFTRPGGHILYMFVFLIAAGAVGVLLYPTLLTAFEANPALNGVILGTLLLGVIVVFGQANVIYPAIRWVEAYWDAADPGRTRLPRAPGLIAAVATLLGESDKHGRLSAASTSAMLDSVGARIDENREISRYLIALLVFIGLLGTFWGLLQTVTAVGDTIATLNTASTAPEAAISQLITGLEAPLSGMGTAFSSSLFGLAGSLVLGFLDLQAGQAQNRFYNDLEEWLSTMTVVEAGDLKAAGTGQSGYVGALLERTADAIDRLEKTLTAAESAREQTGSAVMEMIAAERDDRKALMEELRAQSRALSEALGSKGRR